MEFFPSWLFLQAVGLWVVLYKSLSVSQLTHVHTHDTGHEYSYQVQKSERSGLSFEDTLEATEEPIKA